MIIPIRKSICLLFTIILLIPIRSSSQNIVPNDSLNIKLINAAREIMTEAGTCALTTLDEEGRPRIRVMDPFDPENDLTVWFGTNPNSRKVKQINNDPRVTLYYLDNDASGYVMIYGIAQMVDDQKEKDKRWKDGWKAFYPNRSEDYILIKVSPKWMEVISYSRGIFGDSTTWKPPTVLFDSVINNNTERIKEIKLALDRYLGAEIIGAEADKAFIEKNYSFVKQKLELLFAKYPEYARIGEYKSLLKTIEQIELDEVKREEAEKKEQYRLANINNLGMWSIHHPVNKFGESTKNRYITNTRLIHGTFSNSETKDSKLNVKFLISDSSKISIQLFENAGNMPLKAWSDHSYIVFVQDNDGNSYKITAVNKSDRLEFNKNASIQLHNTLLKGDNVKIRIHEYYNSGNNYQFSIQKADWYENAYRILTNP